MASVNRGAIAALITGAAIMYAGSKGTDPRPVFAPKVIALSSVTVHATRDSTLRARASVFDSLIENVVRGQGFTVIPHDSTDAVAKEASDSLGGLYDPMTGDADTIRFRAIRDATRRRLIARFGTDLWLRAYIGSEGVQFRGERATWHGTTEITGATGGVGRLLIGTKYGTIPALTLEVFVSDTTGRTVYRGAGGIQLLMKAGRGVAKPRDVPNAEIFASPARNAHAVHVALDSLAARLGAERTIAAGLERIRVR